MVSGGAAVYTSNLRAMQWCCHLLKRRDIGCLDVIVGVTLMTGMHYDLRPRAVCFIFASPPETASRTGSGHPWGGGLRLGLEATHTHVTMRHCRTRICVCFGKYMYGYPRMML